MALANPTSAADLTAAFARFEDASETLGAFYRELEQQVAVLAGELESSRLAQARELAEKERLATRLQNLLAALPGGVLVLDEFGTIQSFNNVANDLLGDLNVGDAWADVVARAFAPRWDDGHDVSLVDGRVVNIATQAMTDEQGQILLINDVTETRRLQDQLAHHKRISAKTEMAAAMAHQIRTPLASVLLNVGNLRRIDNPDKRIQATDSALASLRKLERLVDELLLFARGGQLDVAPTNTGDFIAAVKDVAEESLSSDRFSMRLADDDQAGEFYANSEALVSVAMNLLENSYQACNGDGSASLQVERNADQIEFHFTDSGPGIPAHAHAAVFEPFHTSRSNGTGLGLSVARAVARAHGGDLSIREAARGAHFVLAVPMSSKADATVAVGNGSHSHPRNGINNQ